MSSRLEWLMLMLMLMLCLVVAVSFLCFSCLVLHLEGRKSLCGCSLKRLASARLPN